MTMTRMMIGMAVGGMLTLLKAYPAYSRLLPSMDILSNRSHLASTVVVSGPDLTGPEFEMQTIKPVEEALSFSRFLKDGKAHVLAVLKDDGQVLTGVDISAELNRYETNIFEVIKNMPYDEVVRIIHNSKEKTDVRYAALLPSVAGSAHMAIGINYAEHGRETGQVRPFMFPKYVATDPAVHRLKYTDGWLLDHEVELGVVFPRPVCTVADLDKMMIGFLVVNDFTDRADLMRKMDSKNVVGGKGFPDAKSKAGFLPTGPYVVIPKNWRAFVKELHLQLSVNGTVRQNGDAKDMVWDIEKIVEKTLSVKGRNDSFYQGEMVKLFEGDCIPANSIIITGTPSGVVFNAPSKSFIIGAVNRYIFLGGFFHEKMHPYILQRYLKKELDNPRYLKPGDEVESSVSYLGKIKTSVVK